MIYGDIFYLGIEIILGALGIWMAGYATQNLNSKFKLVYLIPGAATLFVLVATSFEKMMLPAYIISILVLAGFFVEKPVIRKLVSVVLIVCMIAEFPICSLSKAYRAPDYLSEFEEAFDDIRAYYNLADHKGTDLEGLYDKYRPEFVSVQNDNDELGNLIAWTKLCDEFKDGHVSYAVDSHILYDQMYEKLYGYDFGFSLVRMESGEIAAINVEPGSSAMQAGISNGTVITSWNGQPIDSAIEAYDAPVYLQAMPVKENEDFIKTVQFAGNSDESLTLGFLDANGANKEITLESTGYYKDRLEASINLLFEGTKETNLTVRALNDNTAFIRVSQMAYDSKSYSDGEYNTMYDQLKNDLQAQKDAGRTNLIIDLRNNSGGDARFDKIIFRLLFPEGEYTMFYNGVWDYDNNCFKKDASTGKYEVGEANTFEGEGFWGDGKIIVLVSAYTVSAGDMFSKVISQLDNVYIMGITSSNCSSQAVNGAYFEKSRLSFSAVPTLEEDGSIFIDPDETRVSTIPLDIKVKVDNALIEGIFDENEDYVLNQAIGYLEK